MWRVVERCRPTVESTPHLYLNPLRPLSSRCRSRVEATRCCSGAAWNVPPPDPQHMASFRSLPSPAAGGSEPAAFASTITLAQPGGAWKEELKLAHFLNKRSHDSSPL
ncbi:hypothetical protein MHYP_G00336090 [Metynnis hypsauchen]